MTIGGLRFYIDAMFGISIRMQTVAYQALICIAIIGFCGNVEGKALNGMAVTHLVNTRVADRFKDWKDGDEYVNHDYYTRKRFAILCLMKTVGSSHNTSNTLFFFFCGVYLLS